MKIRHLFQAAFLFVLFASGGSLAAQQVLTKEMIEAKTIDLCTKESTFELWKLYKDSASYMDERVRHYAEMIIYKNFNRPEKVIESLDSLFTYYPDEGYPLGYYYLKANSLLEMGRYHEFATYCQSLEKDSLLSRDPYCIALASFSRQIEAIPDYKLNFPTGECTVPVSFIGALPYIYLSAKINDAEPQNMILDTGAPFTLLSYKTAKKCNIPLLGDTIIAMSVFGETKTRTGIVKELRIGDIVFQNARVGVALEDVPAFFKEHDLLGLRELQNLSSTELSSEKVIFKKNKQKDDLQPNMSVKGDGLILQTSMNNQIEEFFFDTGSCENYINTHDSISENTVKYHSVLGYSVPFLVDKPKQNIFYARKNKGLLGLQFFQSFESVIFDIDRMAFTGKGYRIHPIGYTQCINSGDYANLETNLQWYENKSGEMGKWTIHAFLGFMKNQPKKCIQYTDSLLAKYKNQMEDGIISILNIRAAAFAFVGDYTLASQQIKDIVSSAPYLKGSLNKCLALAPIGGPQINWRTSKTTLPATLQDKGLYIKVGINQKETGLYFAPDKIENLISPEEAAKYNMKIIEFEEDAGCKKKIAIAEEVVLGGMIVHNMQFNVDEKVDMICMGNNFLRLIPQFVLEKDQLTLSSQSVSPMQNEVSYSLLMINYILCYYRLDGKIVKSFSIGNPYRNAQMVTLKELLEQNKKITFDTRKMYIQLNQ